MLLPAQALPLYTYQEWSLKAIICVFRNQEFLKGAVVSEPQQQLPSLCAVISHPCTLHSDTLFRKDTLLQSYKITSPIIHYHYIIVSSYLIITHAASHENKVRWHQWGDETSRTLRAKLVIFKEPVCISLESRSYARTQAFEYRRRRRRRINWGRSRGLLSRSNI